MTALPGGNVVSCNTCSRELSGALVVIRNFLSKLLRHHFTLH